MRRQTRMRLSLMLLALALVVGLADYAESYNPVAYCKSYGDCQICENLYESCMAGTLKPECAGQDACCSTKFTGCWDCCVWY
jgi:hypothetical protein